MMADAPKHTPGPKCPFCNADAELTQDDDSYRVHACPRCFAANVIGKGQFNWWYFGWVRPDGSGIAAIAKTEGR